MRRSPKLLLAALLAVFWGPSAADLSATPRDGPVHEPPRGICTVTCIGMDGRQVPCPGQGPCIDTYTLQEAAMPYATRADLVARFGADEIDDIAPVNNAGVSVRADAALADADAEIDTALAECYALPLPDGDYPHLKGIACDITRARLYDDAAPERVLGRLSSARKRVARIVAGELHVVAADGTRVPRLERGLIHEGEPIATRERLAGYLGPAPGAEWC